jgi:hypothetical protein
VTRATPGGESAEEHQHEAGGSLHRDLPPSSPFKRERHAAVLKGSEAPARVLGQQLLAVGVERPEDFQFSGAIRGRVDGLVVMRDPVLQPRDDARVRPRAGSRTDRRQPSSRRSARTSIPAARRRFSASRRGTRRGSSPARSPTRCRGARCGCWAERTGHGVGWGHGWLSSHPGPRFSPASWRQRGRLMESPALSGPGATPRGVRGGPSAAGSEGPAGRDRRAWSFGTLARPVRACRRRGSWPASRIPR